jgi:Domain of unknown function (DUF4397)
MIRSLRTIAIAAVALFGVAACSDDDSTGPGSTARLRIVHASPNAPAVDILVDEDRVLQGVPYRNASAFFFPVRAGERRIRVNAAGTNTSVIDATATLDAQSSYTVLATGLLATIAPVIAPDDLTAPAAGQVKVRVIHAAPAAAGVDVYVTAPGAPLTGPVLTNVPFRAVSGYLVVPAGTYQIRVTPTGTTTVAIDATVTFVAGQIRTVVATDAPAGGAPLGAIVLADLN